MVNERVDVPLQAHPQGVLIFLASPWMVRNSLPLYFSKHTPLFDQASVEGP
jgi:hypothetical protein